jgi:type IV pilus assembly protein PilM
LAYKRIFSGRKDVLGLDIGSTFVKAVQLHRGESGYKLISAGREEIARHTSSPDDNVNNTIAAIRRCVKSAQMKTKYVVCGVGGPDVASRYFNFPPLYQEEIANAVLLEAEQVCPFEKGQFIVDYQVIQDGMAHKKNVDHPKPDVKTSGVLVAAMTSIIGRKNQLARKASLNCVLMDVDGLALLNCLVECQKRQPGQTVAILDVGSKVTNMAILGDNGLPFVRDIAHAADDIVRSIAAKYRLSTDTVQNTLPMQDDRDQNAEVIKAGLFQAAGKLIADITETLRFYSVQQTSNVGKLMVCGGFAQFEGFVKLLDNQLPPEVVLWNPFDKIQIDDTVRGIKIIQEHGPSLALAAGLAMRTI